jgi:hypothetical protein
VEKALIHVGLLWEEIENANVLGVGREVRHFGDVVGSPYRELPVADFEFEIPR